MYYLGIDGGGTKTALAIMNNKEEIISEIVVSTCHYMQIGFDGFKEVITDGVKRLLESNQIDENDIEYAVFGIPGYGEIKQDAKKIEDIVVDTFPKFPVYICNDVEIGLAELKIGETGVNIVAGTGSMAFGMNGRGQKERAGGWGHHLLGDEGSAYWIAMNTLHEFCKQADGRKEKTPLYTIIKQELLLEDDFDILRVVVQEKKMDRGLVAQYSQLCFKAAKENDIVAINIFKGAAIELAEQIKATFIKLGTGEEKRTVFCNGGVFKAKEYLLDSLQKNIEPFEAEFIVNEKAPVFQACIYAKKLAEVVVK